MFSRSLKHLKDLKDQINLFLKKKSFLLIFLVYELKGVMESDSVISASFVILHPMPCKEGIL